MSRRAQQAATADDDKAHFELMPVSGPGRHGRRRDGEGADTSFSQSAADVLSNLQLGFMGRTRGHVQELVRRLDGTYMGLGAANDNVDAGLDQVIVEPSVGVQAGAVAGSRSAGRAISSIAMDMKFRGPLAAQVYEQKTWWDPFLGGRVMIPLGEKYQLHRRLDFGGFGAGAKIAGECRALVQHEDRERGTLNAGWKFYYVDYRDNGANFRYAVSSQGPLIGTTFRW